MGHHSTLADYWMRVGTALASAPLSFMYASRLLAELSVCEVDDSGYSDAVCKPRLPAFSWLTHANRDSLRIWSTMKIAFAGKTDYLKIIDFRPALRPAARDKPDEEKKG